jgi:hypothetical protein
MLKSGSLGFFVPLNVDLSSVLTAWRYHGDGLLNVTVPRVVVRYCPSWSVCLPPLAASQRAGERESDAPPLGWLRI